MPSCSASESDSKIRPANFQTRHKPPVRNYRRIQTEEAVRNLQTASSSSSPTFHLTIGPIGSPSIRSLFPVIRGRILSGRISSDTKHSKNTGSIGKRIMPLFPLPPRPIAPAPKEYGQCTRSFGNNLIEKLDSYCGRLCSAFRDCFFGYARSTADRRQSYLFRPGY